MKNDKCWQNIWDTVWGISDSWSQKSYLTSPADSIAVLAHYVSLWSDKSGSKYHVCSLPSHMKTPLPKETIRGKNLCCLSKKIKFQGCNKTKVWLEAIAEATTATLPSGFLIKAATAITVWQMVVAFHRIRVIMFLCSCTDVDRKSVHVIIFKCSFCIWGGIKAGNSLKLK